MRKGITLFKQMQALLPRHVVQRAVTACRGDYKVHRTTCWSYLLSLMAAILTRQRSLRHIERILETRRDYLKQFGVGSLKRATLSHASAHRPYLVAETLFQHLLARCAKVAPGHRSVFTESFTVWTPPSSASVTRCITGRYGRLSALASNCMWRSITADSSPR